MRSTSTLICCLIAMVMSALSSGVIEARGAPVRTGLSPQSRLAETPVTIRGEGVPAPLSAASSVAPFPTIAICRPGRSVDLGRTVTVDEPSGFTATHRSNWLSQEQAGVRYLRKAAKGQSPRLASNLGCFTYEGKAQARAFDATGHPASARFLDFWRDHGGLFVFGYPLTEARQESGRDIQYFERQRFELHPRNQPPYDVLLGRLGAELLPARGVAWQTLQPSEPQAGCMWFGQTGRNVCDQDNGVGFRTYWTSHGLEFDGRSGTSFEESVGLFGYPISDAYVETNRDGDRILTQWFERARFEWHPRNPDQYKVLLGRLGAELVEKEPAAGGDGVAADIVERARQALARQLNVDPRTLTGARSEAQDWPTPALGCPHPDRAYPQVITPGFLLVFSTADQRYDVHSDEQGERMVLCRNNAPVPLVPAG